MAEKWVMQILGAGEVVFRGPTSYLKSYDPDAREPGTTFPTGDVDVTTDVLDAKIFDSMMDVMEEWKRVSTVTPTRPDGEPNRPLSAFHVSPVKIA